MKQPFSFAQLWDDSTCSLYICAVHVFFSTDITGDKLVLSREESTHAVKVLRLQPGDEAIVLDGIGHQYRARYEDTRQKQCFFSVLDKETIPRRSVELNMAVAPTKQMDRFEWFLEKATEIGVERIVPIISQHSERKVVKLERCRKIIVAALKQSQNAWLPEITEPVSFQEYLQSSDRTSANKYIAHCHKTSLPHLKDEFSGSSCEVLIGPEGDFSDEEVQLAVKSGWKEISLSSNRLRTETAAIVAVHCVALNTE